MWNYSILCKQNRTKVSYICQKHLGTMMKNNESTDQWEYRLYVSTSFECIFIFIYLINVLLLYSRLHIYLFISVLPVNTKKL